MNCSLLGYCFYLSIMIVFFLIFLHKSICNFSILTESCVWPLPTIKNPLLEVSFSQLFINPIAINYQLSTVNCQLSIKSNFPPRINHIHSLEHSCWTTMRYCTNLTWLPFAIKEGSTRAIIFLITNGWTGIPEFLSICLIGNIL